MKKIRISRAVTLCTFISLAIGILGFTTRYGLDGYEVYLNDKLVLKQYVNQVHNLRVLPLQKAKETEQLHVVYKHCQRENGPGTGRSIALKTEEGTTLRKWEFAEAKNGDTRMTIALKDLIQLQKKNTGHQLSLFYSSRELDKAEMLVVLRF
ncbi:hypothetical protein [Pedobacter sp. JY14-1]|uniref:hypothetical protein n=1 Tax=Pedobacter sp. JY14-1 TaxID=3034151 RepID=UPI0023E1334A|nr:hypothetical protein [Pedobacter sp. JY14-1]